MQAIAFPANTETEADEMFDAVFKRSLNFRIEMSFERAWQFLRRIESYNEFHAANVLDALERVDTLIPKKYYGEGNPNNGERSYAISVGREGSPVIYLDRYAWRQEAIPDATCKLICREMELIGKADEADHWTEGNRLTFRFWWD
jgi:hypothetical protein